MRLCHECSLMGIPKFRRPPAGMPEAFLEVKFS